MLGGVDPRALGEALRDNLRDRVLRADGARGARSFEESLGGVNLTDAAQQLLDDQILNRAAVRGRGILQLVEDATTLL